MGASVKKSTSHLRKTLAGGRVTASARRATARRIVELEPGNRVLVEIDCAESPLAWLRTRKDSTGEPLISDEQYCAGLRLHADFIASHLSPRTTTNWESPLSGAPMSAPRNDLMHQSEKILAAKKRYYAALDAVGPELSRILVDVCCFATGIETAERALGWPRRSGKVVLQLALTSLARAYGILAPPPSTAKSTIQASAIAGFRPRFPAAG
jgi:hypothetical protein